MADNLRTQLVEDPGKADMSLLLDILKRLTAVEEQTKFLVAQEFAEGHRMPREDGFEFALKYGDLPTVKDSIRRGMISFAAMKDAKWKPLIEKRKDAQELKAYLATLGVTGGTTRRRKLTRRTRKNPQ